MAEIIDVHAHWFPTPYTEAFQRLGGRKAWPEHPPHLDDRPALLEEAGVDVQVVGLGHNQPYFEDAAAADECARLGNDLYAAEIAKHPRLKAFGCVPLPHVDLALAETAR